MGKGDALGLAIRYLEAEDLDEQPVESVGESLIQLEGYVQQLEVERSRRIASFDVREGHKVLGYASAIAFLKEMCRMSGGRAKHLVSVARAAHRFRSTYLSWKYGQISTDQAQQLFRAAEQLPDKYPDAESVLLEIVGDTPDETRRILDYWRHSVDKPGVVLEEELQLARRRLDVTRKANGMVSGSFEMTSLAGETFITALDALTPPPAESDTRTASQRRADALEDLLVGSSKAPKPLRWVGRNHISTFTSTSTLSEVWPVGSMRQKQVTFSPSTLSADSPATPLCIVSS